MTKTKSKRSFAPALIAALLMMLLLVSGATATALIDGEDIVDNTIDAEELGRDVTKVRSVRVIVARSNSDWICNEENPTEEDCVPDPNSGNGARTVTVKCFTGNVTGGGIRPARSLDGLDIKVLGSYPASDSAWTFVLWNEGTSSIPVQLRVTCI